MHVVLIDNLELHYAKDLNIQCAFVFVFFQKPSETRDDEVITGTALPFLSAFKQPSEYCLCSHAVSSLAPGAV